MKALYRKYRPTKLSDVIGQDQVTKPLGDAIKSGKISHAYLFTGPRGCGKTSVARIFAHDINGFKYEIEDSYVDIIEIDAASNTGVDNIRDLREKAMVAPSKGKFKVYIIDEVHMLSKSAFNALLKTLEEPPQAVIFIMATTDIHKVPETILSRAQVYHFSLAAPEIMQKHLKSVAKKEQINITDDAISAIVKRGGGSFRDSISLLDQISTLNYPEITESIVLETFGLPDSKITEDLLAAYQDGDVTKITDLLHQALDSGVKPENLASNLIAEIIKNPAPKLLPLLARLPDVKAPHPEAKILLAFLAEAAEKPVLRVFAPNQSNTAPAPQKAQESQVSTTEPKATATPDASANLDWGAYVQSLREKSAVLANIFEAAIIERKDNKIQVFVEKRIHRNIADSEKNRKVIDDLLPEGIILEIRDAAEHAAKNQKINKISDIMGEVTEVKTDGDPFEQ